ncbi:hypothetical protein NC653_018147 [Populus alba x Populus x berolinensis]|uniref:Uncharacterized protein n=1 Tax=Populus alba x Populus x berolinensis TaxID=444605 RepID=A0AAD6VUL5_9ROSI|nr:hypothetical protein NC653_018147 [Populus alba x Populus x berolinensis]
MAKNKKKTTSSRRSPVRTRQHIQADIPDKSALALAAVPLHPSSPTRSSPLKTLAGGSSPDKYLICLEKNEVIVAEKAISPSTADHVLVEDCSDCDAFEEDEVDYSISDSIPICLPNDTTLNQSVVYETLSKFCKHCRVLGHSTGACTKFSIPVDVDKEGLSDKAGLPTGPSQDRRVSALQRLGKVLQTNKEHDKEHAEAAHTKKGNDKGQPELMNGRL